LDFDDAMALQAMGKNEIKEIVGYDEDFDKVPFVKRIQLENLI